ncbi:MAG: hypothetical protein JRD89_10755 [Deltaproteobacteria bacterium]|nr:hypothetical protein [Deltaproteobacteria bacterium]
MGIDLVVWAGPVARFQVPGATVPGAMEKFWGCRGDKTATFAHCPTLADSWLDAEGRRLPQMLAKLGLQEDEVDNLYYGAFSAGGSALKRLLSHSADREKVRAVLLSDATYSGGTAQSPAPIEGFVRYALDCLAGDKLLIATASASPNFNHGSGAQVMDATRREIESRSGQLFTPGGSVPLSAQPDGLMTLGPDPNVIFADYGMQGGGHAFHPKLAPELWEKILQPWLSGGSSGPPGPGPGPGPTEPPARPLGSAGLVTALLSFALGTATGYVIVQLVEQGARRFG